MNNFIDLAEQEMPSWTERFTQGAQEPGHLLQAVGQAVQVSGQMKQLHLQPVCAAEVVRESLSRSAG